MWIELANGWNPAAVDVVVTVGDTPFQVDACFRSRLPYELRKFAEGLSRGKAFAPEFGYTPAFNVGFHGSWYFLWLFRRRFDSRWIWWAGSSTASSETEPTAASVSYLRLLADQLEHDQSGSCDPG